MDRRTFLQTVGALSVLPKKATAAASCTSFQPRANPMISQGLPLTTARPFTKFCKQCAPRRCFSKMSAAEQRSTVKDLTRAYQEMQKRGSAVAPVSNTSLQYQAWVHELACGHDDMFNDLHNTWRFLPWHRGFVFFHERIIQSIVGPQFRMPVWDWDADGHVPEFYLHWASGNASKRCSEYIEVGPCAMDAWLLTNSWEQFLGAKNGPGIAAGGPHSLVHTAIGGKMLSFDTAGEDPLFYTHHTNVDRCWWYWKQLGLKPDPKWLDEKFYFYDEEGSLVYLTAGDMEHEEALGYKYLKEEQPHACQVLINPMRFDASALLSGVYNLLLNVMEWPAYLWKAALGTTSCLRDGSIPIRLEADLPDIRPETYMVGMRSDSDSSSHQLIGYFGTFSSGHPQQQHITATACFNAEALQFLMWYLGQVELVYGPPNDTRDWMVEETRFPTGSVLSVFGV